MTRPTPAERSVPGRQVEDRGISSRAGNPGTYLGNFEVGGRQYARFRAEPGTWVSSSMKTMGYDQEYRAKDGYGAYRGLVLDPSGKPLDDPDRIRPGDEYLVPERTAPVAPVPATSFTVPAAPEIPAAAAISAGKGSAAPRAPAGQAHAPPARIKRLNLRPAPVPAPLVPDERRQHIYDDLEIEPRVRNELERLLNDPSSEALIAEKLRHLALDGIDEAMAGRAFQEEFGSGDNALYAFVNDWVSNRHVPFIGAWHNTAMLFRRMLEQVEAGKLDDALLTGRIGYSSLAHTEAAWNEYLQENLRLGELISGTAEEVRRTGVVGNLRLGVLGLAGGVVGVVKRLSEFAAGVITLLSYGPAGATYAAFQSLVKVAEVAFQLARTYGKDPEEFLPWVIDTLSRQSRESLERLSKLPPDQQALAVGEVFGEIEFDLLALAGITKSVGQRSIGGSRLSGAPAVTVLEGARGIGGARGLAVAGGPVVTVGAGAANLEVANAVQLYGFLFAFAVASGGSGGGDPRRKRPALEGEVTTYADLEKRGRSKATEAHEVVPHSLLEDLELATRRGIGEASRNNPAILLSPEVHSIVGRYQRYFKVFYRTQRAGKTVAEIISLNIKALQGAGVPKSVISDISGKVLRYLVDQRVPLHRRL